MSRKINDIIENFHDYGIYTPRRTVKCFGSVDEDMADEIISNLHALDHTQGTINVLLNTEGGCFRSAQAIYDAIKGCKNYVRAMCFGSCMSSGTIILQAADERCSAPNTKFMIHYGQNEFPADHPLNIDKWHAQEKKDRKWMEDLYLNVVHKKKPRYLKNDLTKKLIFDTIWNAEEALNWGFIDRIVEVYE